MAVLYHTGLKEFRHPKPYDKDEKIYYAFGWKPVDRQNSHEYLLDDVVKPATSNGFYYACIKPGLSAAAEPTMSTTIDGETTDGTVTWKSVAYDLDLRSGDTFTSTWTASTGVTIDNPGTDGRLAWVRVTGVPTGATEFSLLNHIVVTRADGKIEEPEVTMIIKVRSK